MFTNEMPGFIPDCWRMVEGLLWTEGANPGGDTSAAIAGAAGCRFPASFRDFK
jgi:hypothetical protein